MLRKMLVALAFATSIFQEDHYLNCLLPEIKYGD